MGLMIIVAIVGAFFVGIYGGTKITVPTVSDSIAAITKAEQEAAAVIAEIANHKAS